MQVRLSILFGMVLFVLGAGIIAIAFLPGQSPPVDILDDQSGVVTQSGVYFDSIVI